MIYMIDKRQCYTPYTMNHNDVAERIRQKDATLWKSDPDNIKLINNSLGWLTVADEMIGVVEDLVEFARSVRSRGFQHVMVCGMGGSSLCPEVLRQTFGRQEGFPELLVLDSTDPDTINKFKEQIDAARCLFVIASKSGTTTEPNALTCTATSASRAASARPLASIVPRRASSL